MTSHAQPISTPPGPLASPKRMRKRDSIGVDKRKRDGEGDSVSVANIGNDRHQLLHGPGLGTAVGLPIGSVTTGSIAHADQQLGCVMAGDPRGLYGERRL